MSQPFWTKAGRLAVSDPPTGGNQAVVKIDPEDRKRWGQYTWRLNRAGYAESRIEGKVVMLHRAILDPPKGWHVHHKNGDKLDCRRENLELLSHSDHSKRHGNRMRNQKRARLPQL